MQGGEDGPDGSSDWGGGILHRLEEGLSLRLSSRCGREGLAQGRVSRGRHLTAEDRAQAESRQGARCHGSGAVRFPTGREGRSRAGRKEGPQGRLARPRLGGGLGETPGGQPGAFAGAARSLGGAHCFVIT